MTRTPSQLAQPTLYETDYLQWLEQTARCLKAGQWSEVDIEYLIDEVEDLGRNQNNALKSNLRVLLMHLLKWHYQARKRSRSWEATIVEHRARLIDTLDESPSLRAILRVTLPQQYDTARKLASIETGEKMGRFPSVCPYTIDQILDTGYWPGDN